MREIKFRGKRLDNGNWVYGDLRQENSGRKVIMTNLNTWGDNADDIEPYGEDVYVNTETVGQFTGLYDKNGKEIYEGDIIIEDKDPTIMEIVFQDGIFFASIGNTHGENRFMNCALRVILDRRKTHIIGNIHDNPGLLKGGEKK